MGEDTRKLRRELERLRAEKENLKIENRKLLQRADNVSTGFPAERVEIPPASPVPPASPPPPPPPKRRRAAAAGPKLKAVTARPPAGARLRKVSDAATGVVDRCLSDLREKGAERIVGEKLLNYVGMVLLVLGGAFFLKLAADGMGPLGKVVTGLLAGGGLIGAGQRLRRAPKLRPFSVPVIGGGWALVYFTVYAAHYIDAARVVTAAPAEFVLLCVTAAGMILHSLALRSRPLTSFAFGAAYFVFAVIGSGPQTLTVCAVLAAAGAFLVGPLGSPELAAVNLIGFHVNYYPVFIATIGAQGAAAVPAGRFWYELAAVSAVHAAYFLKAPVGGNGDGPGSRLDLGISFAAILYAAMTCAQLLAYEPARLSAALLSIAAAFTVLSALRGKGEDESVLASVQGVLAALLALLGLIRLETLQQQMWGFALASAALGSAGVRLERRSFEKYALLLAGAGAFFYFVRGAELAGARVLTGSALAFFSAVAYALAGTRPKAEEADIVLSGLWLHAGAAGVLLALRAWFEPASFAVAAVLFAILLDRASEHTRTLALFKQAMLIALGTACLGFPIITGAKLWIFGLATERLLATTALSAGFALFAFKKDIPPGFLLGMPHERLRRALLWLMTSLAAYGAFLEFEPRWLLPVWALGGLLLLSLGREREDMGGTLRSQAYLLMTAAALEAGTTFLFGGGTPGPWDIAIYSGSSLALLIPLSWPSWARSPEDRKEDLAGQHAFSLLSLAMLALFVAEKAQGVHITLLWTGIGALFLSMGLHFRRHALRLPALILLGLCVFKALFIDLTTLEPAYRVLSYTALGGFLVLSSYLYVHSTQQPDRDAA